jgi:hypothetical protein
MGGFTDRKARGPPGLQKGATPPKLYLTARSM